MVLAKEISLGRGSEPNVKFRLKFECVLKIKTGEISLCVTSIF